MPVAPKKAPQASFPKRFMHTFYLVQPVLQFVALLSLLVILSRCSPLAPSTEKNIGSKGPSSGAAAKAEELLKESQILGSFKLLSEQKMTLISDTDFSEASADALQIEQPVREQEVKTRLERRKKKLERAGARRHLPILTVDLTADQQAALWREGKVRISLTDYLQASFDLSARKLLFKDFEANLEKLSARSYAVFTDDNASHNEELQALAVSLKISLGVLSDERAYLELSRSGDQDAASLLAAAQGARKLAVVLE